MRRVEILVEHPDRPGEIEEFTRVVPATPIFEDAFSAFARGTLFPTDRGPVAVEDLLPGDKVRTAHDGPQRLIWRGSTMIVPGAPGQDPAMSTLTRIAADSLGMGRPAPDLILGPRARLVHRGPGVSTLTGRNRAAIPVRDFIDGINIVELTPPSAVPVYHLGFEHPVQLVAHGIEVESFHPGPLHKTGLRGEALALYMSCFPHVRALEEFGSPALPRLRRQDLDIFDVA
jgi:hypothetical protein